MESKHCSLCKLEKQLDQFHRQPRAKSGRHSWCKSCYNARHPKKKQLLPERRRELNYQFRYRMSVTDVESMLSRQGGACMICDDLLVGKKYHVDHDHGTGRVRGILCHRCNVNIPLLENDAWMAKAMRYLGKELCP